MTFKRSCPNCWEEFEIEDILFIAQHRDLVGDPCLGPDAQQRFLPSRFTLERHAVDDKGMTCPDMACPRCHLRIPRAILESNPFIVSLVGAPSSGKSYFLTTIINELRTLMPQKFAFSFSDADPVCNRMINEYEQTLFFSPDGDNLVALKKTEMDGYLYQRISREGMSVSLPHPFVFLFTPLDHHVVYHTQKERLLKTLILYDNAGEHFGPGNDTAANPGTRHLGESKAVLFLFDPTMDPRFREHCRSDDPQLRLKPRTERQEIVLGETIERIRKLTGLRHGQKDQRPLLIVVSKFDVWKDLMKIAPEASPWTWSDSIKGFAIDYSSIFSVSLAVRHLMNLHCPDVVSIAESFFDHVFYLPVSALGRSPVSDPQTGALLVRPKEIRPFWVTVPILFLLARMGAVPRKGTAARNKHPSPHGVVRTGNLLRLRLESSSAELIVPLSHGGYDLRCPETGKWFALPLPEEDRKP